MRVDAAHVVGRVHEVGQREEERRARRPVELALQPGGGVVAVLGDADAQQRVGALVGADVGGVAGGGEDAQHQAHGRQAGDGR